MNDYLCNDCPRNCNAIRSCSAGNGFCKAGYLPKVAKVMAHHWEEPCLSGENGAGNIFFASCNLKCCYCQNYKITLDKTAFDYPAYSVETLRELLTEVAKSPAHNINLVTADCYLRLIAEVLTPEFKESLKKPVVLNCSGYNKPEILELLRGKIDIFLPDFKYIKSNLAEKYSKAPDYPEVASLAIKKMFELAGPCVFDEETGLLLKGVIIRHLILPSGLQNTFGVIDWVNENFSSGDVIFSLMSQYTPCGHANSLEFSELQRTITDYEKRKAEAYLLNTDITAAFVQEHSSANSTYIPNF